MKIRGKSGMMQAVILMVCLYLVSCASVPASKTVPVPEMVLINAGTFMMGTTEKEKEEFGLDEYKKTTERLHKVTLSSFYIGAYEVTQAEYADLMGFNPSSISNNGFPVDCVSWYDAVEYCNRLSKKHKLKPAYQINGHDVKWDRSANGYRLPTEAEWEYACRAETTTAFNTGKDTITPICANFHDVDHPLGNTGRMVIGGSYPPNRWKLYDMMGNVYEWCWDRWEDVYSISQEKDPSGPLTGSVRVLRSGCWFSDVIVMRSGDRENGYPFRRSIGNGFRVARNAGPGSR
jgi:formylglycine-generating enzyme required for sulfatase activity